MLRVLVVDDEYFIRTSLSKKVDQIDEEIMVSEIASNGNDATEWLQSHYADICITDVRMPGMSGLELIEHIRGEFPWMACIVVSSYGEFEYAKKCIQLDAIDYIMKPIEQDALSKALFLAKDKILSNRMSQANEKLIKKLPYHRKILDNWIELLRMSEMEKMPLLIVDTLEMLEDWADEACHLLIPLSMSWLNLVVEELTNQKVAISLHEGKDLGIWNKTIPGNKTKFYFRLCAVRRLEEGAHRIFHTVKNVKDNSNLKVIDQVNAYIFEHLSEKLVLEDIANQVSFSKTYLAKLYKQETGMTIWNYLVKIRMQQSRDLILDSSLKIYEIAQRVGYNDSVRFSDLFKKHYGLTPLEYRKRIENI